MKTPKNLLQDRFADALAAAYPDAPVTARDLVVPAAKAEHGDYQCNQALPLAKMVGAKPRDVAARIVEHLRIDDICLSPEIAGPGFINLRLTPAFIGGEVGARAADPRLGVAAAEQPRTIIIDYSSPNVAKPMHVGHIRSTVIGDALTRTLRFLGHRVIGDNHIGDWGTQFGMILLGYKELADPAALQADPIPELKRIYRTVNSRAKSDEAYKERAAQEVVKLQAEDPEQMRIWTEVLALSRRVANEIYGRLDVRFDVWHGESFYNAMLGEVVEELLEKGIAREDQGAVVVFFDGPDDPPALADKPMIIRKRDGAYLYSTSDLAAIKYRHEHWHPDDMIYVVDGRQQDHFRQVFATARKWGYTHSRYEHVWFGTIQGPDGKPFKTRDGDPPELGDLLDEAEERALAIVADKQPDLPVEQQREVARVVGLGAVKYSDLAQARTSDYMFSWDRMLAMQGNTAPYMQYAYVRICSILEKSGVDPETLNGPVMLAQPAELALAKVLLRFGDALDESAAVYRPNVLTSYLFDVASAFSGFYEQCPVVSAEWPQRVSRLTLCRLVARTLKQGLDLLGIETLPRM